MHAALLLMTTAWLAGQSSPTLPAYRQGVLPPYIQQVGSRSSETIVVSTPVPAAPQFVAPAPEGMPAPTRVVETPMPPPTHVVGSPVPAPVMGCNSCGAGCCSGPGCGAGSCCSPCGDCCCQPCEVTCCEPCEEVHKHRLFGRLRGWIKSKFHRHHEEECCDCCCEPTCCESCCCEGGSCPCGGPVPMTAPAYPPAPVYSYSTPTPATPAWPAAAPQAAPAPVPQGVPAPIISSTPARSAVPAAPVQGSPF